MKPLLFHDIGTLEGKLFARKDGEGGSQIRLPKSAARCVVCLARRKEKKRVGRSKSPVEGRKKGKGIDGTRERNQGDLKFLDQLLTKYNQ
jgi:hypothetical protein